MGSKRPFDDFAMKFKTERKRLGLRQDAFGNPPSYKDQKADEKTPDSYYLGIANPKTVRSWESGQTLPDIRTATELCELFDCDLDYLFGSQAARRKPIADIMEMTGISELAAEKLKKNAFGYWEALSSVLKNDTFWQFLKLLETFKQANTSTDDFSKYINGGLESVAERLLPNPTDTDTDMITDEFFRSVCNRYCWQLMSDYKKPKEA